MDGMNNSNDYEAMLWQLLAKEQLADLAQFHKSGFFDEVPLYSRDADISFLPNHTSDKGSLLLLRFSLNFLKSVLSYQEHRTPFFAAITVWKVSAGDPIVPNLFVWSGPIENLAEKLVLDVVATAFGRKIKRLVAKLHLPDRFNILEDMATTPDRSRVFIAPALPPYQGFVTLDKFRKPLSRVYTSSGPK